jgi:hypothetical protein
MNVELLNLLGTEADSLLKHTAKVPKDQIHVPGPDFVDRIFSSSRPQQPRARQPPAPLRHRPARQQRLHVDPPRRSGHRTLRRRQLRQEPHLLRPREHHPPRRRRRLQRRLLHLRRARPPLPEMGAQDPVPGEDQPQRAADAPEQVRPGDVRQASNRPSTWAPPPSVPRSTSAPPRAPARSSRSARPSPAPTNWAWPPSSGATSATTASRRTRTTTSPPTSPARPTTSASPSRPTSSSRSCPRTTAATPPWESGYGKTDKRIYSELSTDHPIDLCRYQVMNCYMGRIGLINSGGASGATTSPKRSRPPSSTSAPAAAASSPAARPSSAR